MGHENPGNPRLPADGGRSLDDHLVADATVTSKTIIIRVSRKASRKRVKRLTRAVRKTVAKHGGKYAVVVVRAGDPDFIPVPDTLPGG